MKNKLFKIAILTIILSTCLQVSIFASTLKLNIKTNKEKFEVDEEVKVIVSWDKGMQAADFSLLYDPKKLEFVNSELEDYYINNENGEVKTAWFSIDDTDKIQIEYTFKTKKSGIAKLATKINGGFATGELQVPETYEDATLKIKIRSQLNWIVIFVCILVVRILIIHVIRKKK